MFIFFMPVLRTFAATFPDSQASLQAILLLLSLSFNYLESGVLELAYQSKIINREPSLVDRSDV